MGPQEMLELAEVKNKWKLTPVKNFKSPRLTARMWRTALVVMLTSIIYQYLFKGRNPCFALIGAVYGVGSQFEEGFHNGVNRLIGTIVGGILVIPFYWLYTNQPLGIPDWFWLVAGLCLVLWCNLALGADSAIQPGTVMYFVVMFTVGEERVLFYTVARILDTGGGVIIALLITILLPSKSFHQIPVYLRFLSMLFSGYHIRLPDMAPYKAPFSDIHPQEERKGLRVIPLQ